MLWWKFQKSSQITWTMQLGRPRQSVKAGFSRAKGSQQCCSVQILCSNKWIKILRQMWRNNHLGWPDGNSATFAKVAQDVKYLKLVFSNCWWKKYTLFNIFRFLDTLISLVSCPEGMSPGWMVDHSFALAYLCGLFHIFLWFFYTF